MTERRYVRELRELKKTVLQEKGFLETVAHDTIMNINKLADIIEGITKVNKENAQEVINSLKLMALSINTLHDRVMQLEKLNTISTN